MKGIAALLAVGAAACAVGIATAGGGLTPAAVQYSAKPPPSGFANTDTVFGGGHFVFVADHNFSVTATNGGGTLVYSQDQIVGEITCLNVSGNVAVVGGIVRSSANNGNAVGTVFNMYFEDNGQPSGTSVGGDVVSPIELVGPGSAPKTCPAADIANASVLDPLDAGDIAVHAKGS